MKFYNLLGEREKERERERERENERERDNRQNAQVIRQLRIINKQKKILKYNSNILAKFKFMILFGWFDLLIQRI
jgi:hypothetical protein